MGAERVMYRTADRSKESAPDSKSRRSRGDAKGIGARGRDRKPQKGEERAKDGRTRENREDAVVATCAAKKAGGNAPKTPGSAPCVQPNGQQVNKEKWAGTMPKEAKTIQRAPGTSLGLVPKPAREATRQVGGQRKHRPSSTQRATNAGL